MAVFVLVLLVLLLFFLLALPTLIAVKLNRRWKKKGVNKKLGLALLVAAPLLTAYSVHITLKKMGIEQELFHTDDYFTDEFERIALRPIPESAEVVNSISSGRSFNGDYTAVSMIRLSPEDYRKLLAEIMNDNRLVKDPNLVLSSEFNTLMGDIKRESIKFSFANAEDDGKYRYICFLDDLQSIVVYTCVT